MVSSPLLKLRYANREDVAQDLEMVIQSSSEGEWSWEGATAQEEATWSNFVQDPSSASKEDTASLAGRIQVTSGLALSVSLLSSSSLGGDGASEEMAVDVSAPTLAHHSVVRIKEVLVRRSEEWAEEGVESLYLFDLITTAQTLLADEPDLVHSHNQPIPASTSNSTSSPSQEPEAANAPHSITLARVLFWSHHLKAPSKLKDFNNWCPELGLWGIVRVGYPGYLCFEGETSSVDEMVRRVKGLQWHAIQLRVQRSWNWTAPAQTDDAKARASDPMGQALLSCRLAQNHPDNTYKRTQTEAETAKGKVRTGCQVIENLGELVERLRECALDEQEISEALGIKLNSNFQ